MTTKPNEGCIYWPFCECGACDGPSNCRFVEDGDDYYDAPGADVGEWVAGGLLVLLAFFALLAVIIVLAELL